MEHLLWTRKAAVLTSVGGRLRWLNCVCLFHSLRPFRKAPGSSRSWPYVTPPPANPRPQALQASGFPIPPQPLCFGQLFSPWEPVGWERPPGAWRLSSPWRHTWDSPGCAPEDCQGVTSSLSPSVASPPGGKGESLQERVTHPAILLLNSPPKLRIKAGVEIGR